MIRKSLLSIALLSSLTLQADDTVTTGQTSNHGVLGNNYVIAYVGTTNYGDKDTAGLLNSNTQFGIAGSFKATKNIALFLSVEAISADIDYNGITGDASGTALSIGALYHFLPTETIDPYILIALANVSTKVDTEYRGTTYSKSDSANGYGISAGAEFDLSDKVFLTPSASYSKVGDIDASTDIALKMQFQVSKSIYLGGKITIDLDETDTSYFVGVGAKF